MTYETLSGTEPNVDEQHEPRTIGRDREHMMTEIGDGVFVQWSACARCSGRVSDCRCPGGPQEPAYIERWRVNRFVDSFKGRGVEPALPITHKAKDRRINAVLRLLRAEGWTIANPRGDTLSSEEYVVEDLSGVQRGMVDAAIEAVQAESAPEVEATEDDLEFARDTLGPTATEGEVQALADDRAQRDARELLKEREDQFDAGF